MKIGLIVPQMAFDTRKMALDFGEDALDSLQMTLDTGKMALRYSEDWLDSTLNVVRHWKNGVAV